MAITVFVLANMSLRRHYRQRPAVGAVAIPDSYRDRVTSEPLLSKVNKDENIFCCQAFFVQPELPMISEPADRQAGRTISFYSSASIENPCYAHCQLSFDL